MMMFSLPIQFQNLDLYGKRDLDIWDCFGRKIIQSTLMTKTISYLSVSGDSSLNRVSFKYKLKSITPICNIHKHMDMNKSTFQRSLMGK